jgi:hypothetical protein
VRITVQVLEGISINEDEGNLVWKNALLKFDIASFSFERLRIVLRYEAESSELIPNLEM